MRNVFILFTALLLMGGCSKFMEKPPVSGVTTDELKIPKKREFRPSSKISPCEDFYQYACSEELKNFQLPTDKSRWTFAFSDSAERVTRAKKKYLSGLEKTKTKTKTKRVKQLKDNYLACLNKDEQKAGELALIEEIRKELAGVTSKKELFAYLSESILRPMRFSFVSFGKISNLDDPNYNDMYIDTDILSLSHKNYYEKVEIQKDYVKMVAHFFSYYDSSLTDLGSKFHAIEEEFAKIYPLPEQWRDLIPKREYTTQKKLLLDYPDFQLEGLLSQIPDRVKVRNFTSGSYKHIHNLIQKTDLNLLKSYIAYKSLSGVIDEANPEYFKVKFDFQKNHFGGPATREPLEKRCTKMVSRRFGKEIDHELIGELFPNFDEPRFLKLLEKVKSSVKKGLLDNTWLSRKSKKGALEKIEKLKFQVVKPKNELDWDFNEVRDYDSKSPFKNSVTYMKMRLEKEFKELKGKNRKTKWGMSPLTVNAYYSPSNNKFVMPMGILQPPFYDESLSDEANFGAVGMVVSHEIGHAFDDKGAMYDGDGKLRQWMSDKDILTFQEKGKKLGRFYAAYGMNPDLTLGENIGDLVGMDFSYKAAFSNGNATKEQKRKYFRQYARVWCQRIRPKMYEQMLKTDSHSQLPARVNAPIVHFDGFYEAFSCKETDKMYLKKEERVKIW